MERVNEITEKYDISSSPKSQKMLANILKTKKWGNCDDQTIFDEFDRRDQLKVEISQKISETKKQKQQQDRTEIYVEDSRLDKFAQEFETMKVQKQERKSKKEIEKLKKEEALQKQLETLNDFMNNYKKNKEEKKIKKETKIQVQEVLKPIQESLADKLKKLGI